MVNTSTGPLQLIALFVKVGVTVIVAVAMFVPEFVAVKDEISPIPLAAKPILGFELLQE